MAKIEDAVATFERNIEAKTGRSVADWAALTAAQGLAKHGQMVAWLKAEHGLGHGHANLIAHRALNVAAPRSEDDPVAHVFEGKKAEMRPLYERLAAECLALGPDVELSPKKANVSVRRAKQFALLQPGAGRMDVGLILKGREPGGRLEASGSFNAMFTHRVRVAGEADIDGELQGWLKAAYDAAG